MARSSDSTGPDQVARSGEAEPGIEGSVAQSSPSRAMRPPRFSVTGLLAAMAVLAGLLALMMRLTPPGQFALLLGFSAVLAHVAGNAIGTQLRCSSDQANRWEKDSGSRENDVGRERLRADHFAPSTELSQRRPLQKRIFRWTALGAVVGSVLGGFALAAAQWQTATAASIVLGLVACGVLGAAGGFGASSLGSVLLSALRQASKSAR